MKKEMQFRDLDSSEEILKHLMDASFIHSPVTIWQNLSFNRTIVAGHLVLTDIAKKKLAIKCDEVESFSQLAPTYFYVNHQNILFKLNIELKSNNLLLVPVPFEVKIKEHRSTKRKPILADDTTITMRRFSEYETNNYQFSGTLKDYSNSGLGVYVSNRNISRYSRGDMLEVMRIDNDLSQKKMKCSIAYIRPSENPRFEKSFRLGLRFSETQELSNLN